MNLSISAPTSSLMISSTYYFENLRETNELQLDLQQFHVGRTDAKLGNPWTSYRKHYLGFHVAYQQCGI